MDEPVGKAFRRMKSAENRKSSDVWQPRKIRPVMMREETVRRLKFKRDVCCIGGLTEGMSFALTEKDRVDFSNKIGKMKEQKSWENNRFRKERGYVRTGA